MITVITTLEKKRENLGYMWALMDRNLSHGGKIVLSYFLSRWELKTEWTTSNFRSIFSPRENSEKHVILWHAALMSVEAKTVLCHPWYFSKIKTVAIVYIPIKIIQEGKMWDARLCLFGSEAIPATHLLFMAQRCMNLCHWIIHFLLDLSVCLSVYRHINAANIHKIYLFIQNKGKVKYWSYVENVFIFANTLLVETKRDSVCIHTQGHCR